MKCLLFFGLVFVSAAEKSFNWSGHNLCGQCRDQKDQKAIGECWWKNGGCKFGCLEGWEGDIIDNNSGAKTGYGKGKDSRCDVPICPAGHCGSEGVCVEPNVCACPKLTSKDKETGGCYQLRVRGLIGAGASLGIVTLAISLCHIIQTINTRKSK